MSAETTKFLELLEERLSLLNSLASALTDARTDIVSLDITSLEARIAQQEKLCAQIRNLDLQLDRVQSQCNKHLAPAASHLLSPSINPNSIRCRETLDRLSRVQANVMQLNDEHQALLRRSRRTVSALLNSYHSFAMTYSNPSHQSVSTGEGL